MMRYWTDLLGHAEGRKPATNVLFNAGIVKEQRVSSLHKPVLLQENWR